MADRRPEPRLLGWMILAAAGAVALTPFIARPILEVALRGLDAVSVGAVVGSFLPPSRSSPSRSRSSARWRRSRSG